MSFLTAVLLGLVQGIAEFLPISSSGHLVLLQNIFNVEEADLFFDVLLHVGTLVAVFTVYRRDIRGVIRGGFGLIGIGPDKGKTTRSNYNRRRMAIFLIVGSLPLLLAVLLEDYMEAMYHSTALVSLMLMVNGGILFVADRHSRGTKSLQDARVLNALEIGFAQVLAVVPGISRSGATISAGMLCGFRRSFAVQYSFLLSVPAVLGATIVSLIHAVEAGIDPAMFPRYLCGMAAAAVSGYFSIRLLKYLTAHNYFGGFAYYCWGAGLVALVLSLIA